MSNHFKSSAPTINLLREAQLLMQACPNHNWYIAGGAAATPSRATDIDIFTPTKADYDEVLSYVFSTAKVFGLETVHAYTFTPMSGGGSRIQLVKYFYPIQEQLSRFDLNVCRVAIDSYGNCHTHPTTNLDMYIDSNHFRNNSVSRLLKYADRGFQIDYDKLAANIRTLAGTPILLDNYYEGSSTPIMSSACTFGNLFINPEYCPFALSVIMSLPQSQRLSACLALKDTFIADLNHLLTYDNAEAQLLYYLRIPNGDLPLARAIYPEYFL